MRGSTGAFLIVLAALCLPGWRCDPFLPADTKDRISAEALARKVAAPMATVEEKGLAAGQAEFERLHRATLTRFGPDSVEAADLLMAFGLGLHEKWTFTEDRRFLAAAHGYVRASVPAYRRAFGSDHQEVALALNSFADLDLVLHERRPTPESLAALRETLEIRRRALGPRHPETKAVRTQLAALSWQRRARQGARAAAEVDAALDYEPDCLVLDEAAGDADEPGKPRPGGCGEEAGR
ncbi:MAG: tetratricopeptide repeat protein [Allosphingosinicella sp.]